MRKKTMVDWTNLPSDLLQTIADRLLSDLADYVRLRAVCSSWRSAAADHRNRCSSTTTLPPQHPWIQVSVDCSAGLLSFSSFSNVKSPLRRRWISLPSISRGGGGGGGCLLQGSSLLFSCDGWLVFGEPSTLTLSLFNPLTGDHVRLPPLSALPVAAEVRRHLDPKDEYTWFSGDRRVTKPGSSKRWLRSIAFSSSPNSRSGAGGGCTVVANLQWQRTLAVLRAGEEDWSVAEQGVAYDDVIFHRGSFYAVDGLLRVTVFKADDLEKTVLVSDVTVEHRWPSSWRFVAEAASAGGGLLLLRRNYGEEPIANGEEEGLLVYETESVEAYRLVLKGDDRSSSSMSMSVVEVEVKDILGEQSSLFLGIGRSFAFPTGGYPNHIFMAPEAFIIESVVRVSDIAIFRANGAVGIIETRTDYSTTKFSTSLVWHMPSLS